MTSKRDGQAIDRHSMSVAEFNDLLSFTAGHGNPTTHAPIIRDDNDLLIYANRSKNAESEWEIRGYEIVSHDVRFTATDQDRANLAAILVEEFGGDDLTTDEQHVNHRPVRYGVPVAVAVDGKPAVAAWLYVQGETREGLAELMDVGERTVGEYLSRFRRRGIGLPDDLDIPAVGDVLETVPARFDPGSQQIVAADGGATSDGE